MVSNDGRMRARRRQRGTRKPNDLRTLPCPSEASVAGGEGVSEPNHHGTLQAMRGAYSPPSLRVCERSRSRIGIDTRLSSMSTLSLTPTQALHREEQKHALAARLGSGRRSSWPVRTSQR